MAHLSEQACSPLRAVRELAPTEKMAPDQVAFVKLEGLGKVPFSNIRRCSRWEIWALWVSVHMESPPCPVFKVFACLGVGGLLEGSIAIKIPWLKHCVAID